MFATNKRLDAEISWLSKRLRELEERPYKQPSNYTLDVVIKLLTDAGILVEVEKETLKGKVVYNDKTYKVRKVK